MLIELATVLYYNITSDNGAEFAEHKTISKKLNADFYLLILIHLRKEGFMNIQANRSSSTYIKEQILVH